MSSSTSGDLTETLIQLIAASVVAAIAPTGAFNGKQPTQATTQQPQQQQANNGPQHSEADVTNALAVFLQGSAMALAEKFQQQQVPQLSQQPVVDSSPFLPQAPQQMPQQPVQCPPAPALPQPASSVTPGPLTSSEIKTLLDLLQKVADPQQQEPPQPPQVQPPQAQPLQAQPLQAQPPQAQPPQPQPLQAQPPPPSSIDLSPLQTLAPAPAAYHPPPAAAPATQAAAPTTQELLQKLIESLGNHGSATTQGGTLSNAAGMPAAAGMALPFQPNAPSSTIYHPVLSNSPVSVSSLSDGCNSTTQRGCIVPSNHSDTTSSTGNSSSTDNSSLVALAGVAAAVAQPPQAQVIAGPPAPHAAPPSYRPDARGVDPSYPLTGIQYPGQHDCMFGRGGGTSNHIGNINFRLMVEKYKKQYAQASKLDKPKVTEIVLRQWRSLKPPGRFLTRANPEQGNMSTWLDVGDKRGRRKCAQALREKQGRCREPTSSDEEGRPPHQRRRLA